MSVAVDVKPWWGTHADPVERWPGIVREIPCAWTGERWQSPDGRYWFDEAAADFAEQFFPRCLKLHIGDWNGQPFRLLDYQAYLVRALFGWKRARDDKRRFRKVFLAVPKGSGKSPFAAGLGLFGAFFDGEPGAEAYALAADRQQAGIVFDSAKLMVQLNESWQGMFEVYLNTIKKADNNQRFQVLSSDAATKHGFRPHVIVFDEFHAQPNRDLYETMYRGMGKRSQPILMMITTAGSDDESVCYEEWDFARRVIAGTVAADDHLPMVFEARSDEDWTDEETWRRVYPAYDVIQKAEWYQTECQLAKTEPRKRNAFLQLQLNRWVNQAEAWIPIEWWDACQVDTLDVEGLQCAAGLDLSQKWDLTAFVVVFRRMLESADAVEVSDRDDQTGETVSRSVDLNYELVVVPYFWIPEDTLRQHEREDGVPYSQWVEDGLITATEGQTIDYSRVYRDITQTIVPRFPRLKQGLIGYDPAFATDIAQQLRDRAGLKTHEVLQNYQHLSESCQVVEALIKAGRVQHDGHRVLRNHVENVAVKTDDAKRIRPVKPKKAAKHIDGVVALLMANKGLMLTPPRRKVTNVFAA